MTIKVKYEDGKLTPMERITLENHRVYEIEITDAKATEVKTVKAEELKKLSGIMAVGGDAVKDTEDCFE